MIIINMHKLQLLKQMIEDKDYSDIFKELLNECINEFSDSKQNKRGLITLIIRYYININDLENIKTILYNNHLMRRDYLSCLDYFLKINQSDYYYSDIEYIYNNIDDIETKDVDLMIENKWIDLLKKFDGLMVECSLKSNVTDTSKLKKYKYDISIMKNKYTNRILNKEELDRVIEVYKQSGKTLTVGFNRRFAPLAVEMKKALGTASTPMNIVATMNAGFIPSKVWIQDMEVGGGRIIGEACHFIDLITYLTESKVKSVCMNSLGTQPEENTDNASILLKYENGTNAVINYFANGINGTIKRATILMILMSGLMAGPAVSL
jgi:hypothetical protein